MEFVGLENVSNGKLVGPDFFCRSRTKYLDTLKEWPIASSAGDHGAVTVWKRDDGLWNCRFDYYCVNKDEGTFKTKKQVAAWLDINIPKQHDLSLH